MTIAMWSFGVFFIAVFENIPNLGGREGDLYDDQDE